MEKIQTVDMREMENERDCGKKTNSINSVTASLNAEKQSNFERRKSSKEGGSGSGSELDIEVDYKEEEVELMAKDELEELLGLQVQFGESSTLPVDSTETLVSQEEKTGLYQRRNPVTAGQLAQVDIGAEAFKMWSDVGTLQGLRSDQEIAIFLLQHFENTKNILLSSSKCSICNQPLSLFCLKCNLPSSCQSQPSSAMHSPEQTVCSSEKEAEAPRMDNKKSADIARFSKGRKRKKRKRCGKVENTPASVVKYSSVSMDNIDSENSVHGLDDNAESEGNRIEEDLGCVDDIPSEACLEQKWELVSNMSQKQERVFTNGKCLGPAIVLSRREGKVFKCKICGHSYTRACSLKAHMRKHTGEKPFKCTRCDAAFSLSGSLIVHHRTHTGDKPYVCEDCGHSFSISSALKQHRRQHTGEKPYHCKICLSKYSRSDSLRVHMRTHSGDRPFICEECGADFSRLYCLIAHKKKHSGERPFQCTECQATFTQSGKLTIHMRKHTGDRPFQCEQCGASFAQSDRLKTHLRIHSGEKPYKCGECGKGFSHPHSLKVHSRVHTGDRPYKCEVCSLTFADPSYFRRHKAKHATSAAASDMVAAVGASASDSVAGIFSVPVSSADDFEVPMPSTEEYNVLQSANVGLSAADTSTIMAAGFPNAGSSSMTTGGENCFSVTSAGLAIANSSPVPSLGFSVSNSDSLVFSVPSSSSAMKEASGGSDAASGVSGSDPFSLLRSALHCPESYPS